MTSGSARIATIGLLVVALGMTAVSCGEESTPEAGPPPGAKSDTQALEDRIAELEAEADQQARKAARERRRRERERRARLRRERQQEQAQEAATTVPEETDSGGIIVPDVVGLDHQAAQDALQGEGLWVLDEADATGQGRLLLFDRNWEVVRTDPAAGSQVSEDTTITLYSKKQGE